MDRRRFIQTFAAGAATLNILPAASQQLTSAAGHPRRDTVPANKVSLEGHTLLCSFSRNQVTWKVYEDFRARDGVITFVSSLGTARVLRKYLEPVFPEVGPRHLGLDIKDIGLSGPDLLADKLLTHGDPREAEVRRAAPPIHSGNPVDIGYKAAWDTFVGTSECSDTTAIYNGGQTRTYHPIQYFPELTPENIGQRYEGLVGGWMPAVHKIIPGENNSYYDMVIFGDVVAKKQFIVETWHRTAHIVNGKVAKVEYGYTYPVYTRRRQPPAAEAFYLGLLEFVEYWEEKLDSFVPMTLPDRSWSDMARYSFVKEQIVRPGGIYPKYGVIDREYLSSEYDGFQDTFTMSFYANLECGRLELAEAIFDNYFSEFVDAKGMVDMRGPETGQYGLTLALIARYYHYTKNSTLLMKHRAKIEAMATLLAELHDEACKLPASDRGYGLIHGWCESDSCLGDDPSIWWKPYFANSAFAVRGWREIAQVWSLLYAPAANSMVQEWTRRSDQLQTRLQQSIDSSTDYQLQPPYIGPLPGTTIHFREAQLLLFEERLKANKRNEQEWAGRCYSELLQANILTEAQANRVINCMRAYGGTTIGIPANVDKPNPANRKLVGFISYGYARMLLQLDRVEGYILFLYAHRYHAHSRGSWTAAEVADVIGGDPVFCIPAQQAVPLLLRWMLVCEDDDKSRLYFGRAIPREWISQGKPLAVESAPTRWGRVSYSLTSVSSSELVAMIQLPPLGKLPEELHVRFRVPDGAAITQFKVNKKVMDRPLDHETILIRPEGERKFEVIAYLRN